MAAGDDMNAARRDGDEGTGGRAYEYALSTLDNCKFDLDHERYVHELVRAITATVDREVLPEAYTIALTGSWGAGKTTIINTAVERLKAELARRKERRERVCEIRKHSRADRDGTGAPYVFSVSTFECLWFSDEESLLLAFVSHLAHQISLITDDNDCQSSGKFNSAMTLLLTIISSVRLKVTFPIAELNAHIDPTNIAQMYLNKGKVHGSIEQQIQELRKLMFEHCREHRLVIILDDLDRMPDAAVMAMMRIIMTLGSLPGIIFVMGYDRTRLHQVINRSLMAENNRSQLTQDNEAASAYLEKIIRYRIDIIPAPQSSIASLTISNIYDEIAPGRSHAILDSSKSMHVGQSVRSMIASFITTPRQSYRLSDSVVLAWKAAGGSVRLEQVIVMELLRLHRPELFSQLATAIFSYLPAEGEGNMSAAQMLMSVLTGGRAWRSLSDHFHQPHQLCANSVRHQDPGYGPGQMLEQMPQPSGHADLKSSADVTHGGLTGSWCDGAVAAASASGKHTDCTVCGPAGRSPDSYDPAALSNKDITDLTAQLFPYRDQSSAAVLDIQELWSCLSVLFEKSSSRQCCGDSWVHFFDDCTCNDMLFIGSARRYFTFGFGDKSSASIPEFELETVLLRSFKAMRYIAKKPLYSRDRINLSKGRHGQFTKSYSNATAQGDMAQLSYFNDNSHAAPSHWYENYEYKVRANSVNDEPFRPYDSTASTSSFDKHAAQPATAWSGAGASQAAGEASGAGAGSDGVGPSAGTGTGWSAMASGGYQLSTPSEGSGQFQKSLRIRHMQPAVMAQIYTAFRDFFAQRSKHSDVWGNAHSLFATLGSLMNAASPAESHYLLGNTLSLTYDTLSLASWECMRPARSRTELQKRLNLFEMTARGLLCPWMLIRLADMTCRLSGANDSTKTSGNGSLLLEELKPLSDNRTLYKAVSKAQTDCTLCQADGSSGPADSTWSVKPGKADTTDDASEATEAAIACAGSVAPQSSSTSPGAYIVAGSSAEAESGTGSYAGFAADADADADINTADSAQTAVYGGFDGRAARHAKVHDKDFGSDPHDSHRYDSCVHSSDSRAADASALSDTAAANCATSRTDAEMAQPDCAGIRGYGAGTGARSGAGACARSAGGACARSAGGAGVADGEHADKSFVFSGLRTDSPDNFPWKECAFSQKLQSRLKSNIFYRSDDNMSYLSAGLCFDLYLTAINAQVHWSSGGSSHSLYRLNSHCGNDAASYQLLTDMLERLLLGRIICMLREGSFWSCHRAIEIVTLSDHLIRNRQAMLYTFKSDAASAATSSASAMHNMDAAATLESAAADHGADSDHQNADSSDGSALDKGHGSDCGIDCSTEPGCSEHTGAGTGSGSGNGTGADYPDDADSGGNGMNCNGGLLNSTLYWLFRDELRRSLRDAVYAADLAHSRCENSDRCGNGQRSAKEAASRTSYGNASVLEDMARSLIIFRMQDWKPAGMANSYVQEVKNYWQKSNVSNTTASCAAGSSAAAATASASMAASLAAASGSGAELGSAAAAGRAPGPNGGSATNAFAAHEIELCLHMMPLIEMMDRYPPVLSPVFWLEEAAALKSKGQLKQALIKVLDRLTASAETSVPCNSMQSASSYWASAHSPAADCRADAAADSSRHSESAAAGYAHNGQTSDRSASSCNVAPEDSTVCQQYGTVQGAGTSGTSGTSHGAGTSGSSHGASTARGSGTGSCMDIGSYSNQGSSSVTAGSSGIMGALRSLLRRLSGQDQSTGPAQPEPAVPTCTTEQPSDTATESDSLSAEIQTAQVIEWLLMVENQLSGFDSNCIMDYRPDEVSCEQSTAATAEAEAASAPADKHCRTDSDSSHASSQSQSTCRDSAAAAHDGADTGAGRSAQARSDGRGGDTGCAAVVGESDTAKASSLSSFAQYASKYRLKNEAAAHLYCAQPVPYSSSSLYEHSYDANTDTALFSNKRTVSADHMHARAATATSAASGALTATAACNLLDTVTAGADGRRASDTSAARAAQSAAESGRTSGNKSDASDTAVPDAASSLASAFSTASAYAPMSASDKSAPAAVAEAKTEAGHATHSMVDDLRDAQDKPCSVNEAVSDGSHARKGSPACHGSSACHGSTAGNEFSMRGSSVPDDSCNGTRGTVGSITAGELAAAQDKIVRYRLSRIGTFELLEHERDLALILLRDLKNQS